MSAPDDEDEDLLEQERMLDAELEACSPERLIYDAEVRREQDKDAREDARRQVSRTHPI